MKNHSSYEVLFNNERLFPISVTKADGNKLLCRIIKFANNNIQRKNSLHIEIPLSGYDFEIENSLRTSKEIENDIIIYIKEMFL
jgi:hypothetical protein